MRLKLAHKWFLSSVTWETFDVAMVDERQLFQSVVNDPSNKLHDLLPTRCNVGYNLRRERRFAQPLFRTKIFADSFVNRCVSEEMYS